MFHRAISQSGTNLSPWSQPAYPGIATQRAIAIAEWFQCYHNDTDWSTILDCLRDQDSIEITKFFYKLFVRLLNFFYRKFALSILQLCFLFFIKKWDYDPMVPYPPVVEPDLPGAFITKHPRDLWNIHGNSIPWLSGINTEEGVMKTAS